MATTYTASLTLRSLKPAVAAMAVALAMAPASQAFAAATIAAASHAPYHGPKKTLAVSGFDTAGALAAKFGGWDISNELAAMLATELTRTNRFIMVERRDLDTLTREQQMAASGVTSGNASTPLLGAQTFIRGAVTEFEEQESGGGVKLGFATGSLLGNLASRKSTGHVSIDLRMIDAASGVVLASYTIRKRISSSSLGFDASRGGLSLGTEQFAQSSIGKAMREAMAEAALALVAGMQSVPWQALVSQIDGGRVYINAGRNANLSPGARMRAVRQTRSITDPATGEVLGSEQRTIGDFVIESVEDRYAVGRLIGAPPLQRGDIVRLLEG